MVEKTGDTQQFLDALRHTFHILVVFGHCSWEALGRLLGGRLGAGNLPQDRWFNHTKYQPDWLHITSIREGF